MPVRCEPYEPYYKIQIIVDYTTVALLTTRVVSSSEYRRRKASFFDDTTRHWVLITVKMGDSSAHNIYHINIFVISPFTIHSPSTQHHIGFFYFNKLLLSVVISFHRIVFIIIMQRSKTFSKATSYYCIIVLFVPHVHAFTLLQHPCLGQSVVLPSSSSTIILRRNNNYHNNALVQGVCSNTRTIIRQHHNPNNQKHLNSNKNYYNNDDNDDSDPLNQIIQPLESLLIFLSTPIPPPSSSSYSLPLVYPFTIIALNLVLDSWTNTFLLDFLFIGFFLLARSTFVQGDDDIDDYNDNYDDDDDNNVFQLNNKILDLVVLFGSVVSTAILSPTGFQFFDVENIGIGNWIGLSILGICTSSGIIVNVQKWNDKYTATSSTTTSSRNNRVDRSNDDGDGSNRKSNSAMENFS